MNQEQFQIIDYNYAVLCRFCKSKSLDPDKKNNQQFLNCKCRECGKDPREEKLKRKSKKHAKR